MEGGGGEGEVRGGGREEGSSLREAAGVIHEHQGRARNGVTTCL